MLGDDRAFTNPPRSGGVGCVGAVKAEHPGIRPNSLSDGSIGSAISWEKAIAATAIAAGGRTSRAITEALETLSAEIQLGEGRRARLFRPIRGPRRIRLPERIAGDAKVRLLLSRDGRTGYARRVNQVDIKDLVFCHPMRDFSRRHGQSNKPVAFFSRTVGDLVACESQHERRFAILADWHEDVVHIAAQPFTIDFPPGSDMDSHTPDFALVSAGGAVVIVDVKWPSDAVDPDVVRRLEVVRRLLGEAGMQHAVWAGTDRTITDNVANFAAARVPESMMRDLAPKLIAAHRSGIRVGELVQIAADTHRIPASTLLVLVRRLLWDHQFAIDMSVPLTAETELRVR